MNQRGVEVIGIVRPKRRAFSNLLVCQWNWEWLTPNWTEEAIEEPVDEEEGASFSVKYKCKLYAIREECPPRLIPKYSASLFPP
jgi:hypothetical protein